MLASDTPVMTEQGPCRMPFLVSGEVSGVVAPGAIGSRGVADEAPGHLRQ